jgi:hypothetical protein
MFTSVASSCLTPLMVKEGGAGSRSIGASGWGVAGSGPIGSLLGVSVTSTIWGEGDEGSSLDEGVSLTLRVFAELCCGMGGVPFELLLDLICETALFVSRLAVLSNLFAPRELLPRA